jgi:hypothetical protein
MVAQSFSTLRLTMLAVAESEAMLKKARTKMTRAEMRAIVSSWPWQLAEEFGGLSAIYTERGCWLSCEELERMQFEKFMRRIERDTR